MTEFNIINSVSVENMCRTCLEVNSEVRAMSTEEIIWYQSFSEKVPQILSDMYICTICGYLLRKLARFVQQCQKTEILLKQELQSAPSPQTSIKFHNFSTSPPKVYYIGPEADQDLKVEKMDSDCEADHKYSEDDEVPLVMLSEDKGGRVRRESAEVKSELMNDNENSIELEPVLILEPRDEIRRERKAKKEPKEGFSSRMVQETHEYLVIKLTKEQVVDEMQEKRKSDKYKRAQYKCKLCAKGFNFEDVLSAHMRRHTRESGDLQCDICTQYCPSAVSLRGHMKSHTTRYKCKVCGGVRLSRQHLLEHHAIAHTAHATQYSCELCDFTSNKRTVIQRHVKTHRPSEQHACDQCGRLFQNMESLRVHTTRHDKSKRLQCADCGQRFVYPSLLQRHEQCVHRRADYYCVECDVRFKSLDNLRLHFKKARMHRDPSSYTHECPLCDKKFVSLASLCVHRTSVHGEPKNYSCEMCRRLYSSRESLKGHVRRVHGKRVKPAPQTCTVCKESFSRKSVLTVHMRTHKEHAQSPTRVSTTSPSSRRPLTSQGHRSNSLGIEVGLQHETEELITS